MSFLTLESSYLSVEQDRNKIELINLQTKVIEELKKQVEELSPKRGSFIKKVGRCLSLLYSLYYTLNNTVCIRSFTDEASIRIVCR